MGDQQDSRSNAPPRGSGAGQNRGRGQSRRHRYSPCFRIRTTQHSEDEEDERGTLLSASTPPSPSSSVDESYPREVLTALESLWRQGKLCDVEIDASGEGTLTAHRVVLAAASPYFNAMFTSDLRESQMQRIRIHGVGKRALEIIVQFAYTGRIEVDEKNVCHLLPAANMLQVQRITNACCRFLERQLDPSNCIGIEDFAHQHGMRDLSERAGRFVEQHFSMVSCLDEFLSLPCTRLVALLRKDALNVHSESEVYEALVRWVRHDQGARADQLEHALRAAVRCHRLAPSFLRRQISHCALLKDRPRCNDYLAQILQVGKDDATTSYSRVRRRQRERVQSAPHPGAY